jgi:hypothetical protein
MTARQLIAVLGLAAALGAGTLASCAGPTYVVEMYAGPRRPAETIAILRFGGADDARLVVVDGERADVTIADDARLHVEVLPGEHQLGVISRADPHAPLSRVSFRAEPGKLYRVVFEAGGAKIYEIDPGTDALLRDVTLARRTEGPHAPRQPPPLEELSAPSAPPAPEPPLIELEPDQSAPDAGDESPP